MARSSGHPRAHRRGGDGTRPPRRPTETCSALDSEPNSTYNPRAYPSRVYRATELAKAAAMRDGGASTTATLSHRRES